MNDATSEKLHGCFQVIFPHLPPEAIPSATAASVAGWDSIAHVTLLSLIGEEFGLDIDFEAFEGATSFVAILERLQGL